MCAMSEMQMESRVPQLTLGWRLKLALSTAGIQAGAIATDLGVDRATVSRWMGDRGAAPKRAYLRQWAWITRVDYDWLTTGVASSGGGSPDGAPIDGGSSGMGNGAGSQNLKLMKVA